MRSIMGKRLATTAVALLVAVTTSVPATAWAKASRPRSRLGKGVDAVVHTAGRALRLGSYAAMGSFALNGALAVTHLIGHGNPEVVQTTGALAGVSFGAGYLAHHVANEVQSSDAFQRHQARLDKGEVLLRHRVVNGWRALGERYTGKRR
jgi:hypothetical protein